MYSGEELHAALLRRREQSPYNVSSGSVIHHQMQIPDEIAALAGSRPDDWEKPKFGSTGYILAHRLGWITDEEVTADKTAKEDHAKRALQTSHRFKWTVSPYPVPADTDEYVPEMNARLIKDRNLTPSALRIVQFIMKRAYQECRNSRQLPITVSYIMEGLKLSRRTVQRALTLLESSGYIHCLVAIGEGTKMCVGLIVSLLAPLFPRHHRKKWPAMLCNPGASDLPQKKRFYLSMSKARAKVSRNHWTIKCMDGVFKNFMKTNPLFKSNKQFI